jgi:hypothetical protein
MFKSLLSDGVEFGVSVLVAHLFVILASTQTMSRLVNVLCCINSECAYAAFIYKSALLYISCPKLTEWRINITITELLNRSLSNGLVPKLLIIELTRNSLCALSLTKSCKCNNFIDPSARSDYRIV